MWGRRFKMSDSVTNKVILQELVARPGQSRYLLASHLGLPPSQLETNLNMLAEQGKVVKADVEGDEEPVFWASKTWLNGAPIRVPEVSESH
jgi:hypothetical protein